MKLLCLAWLALCLADDAQNLRGNGKAVTVAPIAAKPEEVGAVAKEPAEKEVPTAKGDNQVSQSEVGAVAKEPQVPQAKGPENETPQQESGTVGKDAGGVVTPAKSDTVKAEDSDEIGKPVAEYPAYYYPSEWEYAREWEAEREFWEDLDAPYEVFEGPGPEEVEEVGVVVPELDPEGPPVVAQAATDATAATAATAAAAAAATAATATTAGTGAPAPVALWRRGGGRRRPGRPGRWGRRPGRWGRPGRRPWGRPIYRPRPYYRPGYCLRWAYYYGGRYCAYWR